MRVSKFGLANTSRRGEPASADARLRAVFDHTTQFIALLKSDGTIVEANRAALSLRRLHREDVVGKRIWKARWWDFSPPMQRKLKEAILNAHDGEPVHIELEMLDTRGTSLTFEFLIQRVEEQLLIAQGRDITAQRRVENALRRSRDELELRIQTRTTELDRANSQLRREIAQRQQGEEASARLAAIVESSADAIIGETLEGNITSWNKSAERMFGYSAGEVIGRPISILIPPDRADEMSRILSKIRRGEHIDLLETDRVSKTGRRVTVSLSISPIRDTSGRIIGLAKIARDVTERRQVLTALHDNEARLRAILTTTIDGIITISETGIIESANPAAERIFGYNAAELIGKNVSMLMPDPDASQHDGYLVNYIRGGPAKIIGIGREVSGLRRNGDTFPMELAVNEVWVGGRRLFTGFVRDITERRRLEKAILDIIGAEQQRIGQDLHDGLGQHLTGIALKARVLADDLAVERSAQAKAAREIGTLVQTAIARTRDLARGLAPVSLQKLGFTTALQDLARTTQQMGVRCVLKAPHPVTLESETVALHLYRIAQESINNAIKHGHAGNITISIEHRRGEIVLRIRDDGVGLSEKTKASPGMGLRVMQFRAGLIGAALATRSGSGGGTEVVCILRDPHEPSENPNGDAQATRRETRGKKIRPSRR